MRHIYTQIQDSATDTFVSFSIEGGVKDHDIGPAHGVVYFAVPSFSCHLLNVSCAVAILSPILASSSYFSQVAAFSIHCESCNQYYITKRIL